MRTASGTRAALASLCACVWLTACGGGGGGGGGGSGSPAASKSEPAAATEVSLSRQALRFDFLKKSNRIEANGKQLLHVGFTGDVLRVAYAPGASVQQWLHIPPTVAGEPARSFDLEVEAFPTYELPGTYRTSVRVAARNADGSGAGYVDLPIEMVVHATPAIHGGTVSFSMDEGAAVPAAQRIPLDLGTLQNPQLSISIENGNSIAAGWLQAALSGRELTLQPRAGVAPGSYEGYVRVDYTAYGTAHFKRIPVKLDVARTATAISYVTLSSSVPGGPADLIIRGHGFTLGSVSGVKIGAVAADSFRVVNDTQIVAHVAQLPAAGQRGVQIAIGGSLIEAPHPVPLSDAVPFAAGDLVFTERVVAVRFNPAAHALIVGTQSHLHRVEQVAGAWQVVRSEPWDGYPFDFSPDYRELVVAYTTHIQLLDANSFQPTRRFDLPNAQTGGTGFDYVNQLGVMNNGEVLLRLTTNASWADNYAGTPAVFRLSDGTLRPSGLTLRWPLTGQSDLRDSLFIGANRDDPTFVGTYSAETSSFVPTALPATDVGYNLFDYSGDGSAVLLGDSVYSTATGARTYSLLYAPLKKLSPDGSRIYLIDAGAGKATAYAVSNAAPTELATYSFQAYNYYGSTLSSFITPDGKALVLYGGGGSRVVIVPLP